MKYYFALLVNFYNNDKIKLDPIKELYLSDYASKTEQDCEMESFHLLRVIEHSDFADIWQRVLDWNANKKIKLNLDEVRYISLSIEKLTRDDTKDTWMLCEHVFETPLNEVRK